MPPSPRVHTLCAQKILRCGANQELHERLLGFNVDLGHFDRPASTAHAHVLLDGLGPRSIAGSGLDVFWNGLHIDSNLLPLDNEVLQSHHASGTKATRRASGPLVRSKLQAHSAGQPLLACYLDTFL